MVSEVNIVWVDGIVKQYVTAVQSHHIIKMYSH